MKIATAMVMKNPVLLIVVLATSALAVACNKSSPAMERPLSGGTNSSAVSQTWATAKGIVTNSWQQTETTATNALKNANRSVQTALDYAFDKKNDCVAQAGAELDFLDQKIQELSVRAAAASDSVKADAQTRIRKLGDQRAVLNQKMAALQNATATNWDEAKDDFNKTFGEAKTSCQDAWQWLAKKLGS